MLYDKRWDAKVKTADPLSLDGLIEWLEQQPANKTYNWMDRRGSCLLCQYVTARSIGSTWMRGYLDLTMKVPATEDVAFATPWTFGAALNRARALMPD